MSYLVGMKIRAHNENNLVI